MHTLVNSHFNNSIVLAKVNKLKLLYFDNQFDFKIRYYKKIDVTYHIFYELIFICCITYIKMI